MQAGDEHVRRHAEVADAHGHAAEQAGHHRQEGQQRQHGQQREQARQHQQLDRVQAEGADRVDFLAALHRADLRGEGAGGAAGEQDRGEQYAEFAQEGDRHQFDDEHLGAEFAQHGRAEEGDHRADHEAEQQHQRHRVQADLFHVMHGRGQADPRRSQQRAHRGLTRVRPPKPISARISCE